MDVEWWLDRVLRAGRAVACYGLTRLAASAVADFLLTTGPISRGLTPPAASGL